MAEKVVWVIGGIFLLLSVLMVGFCSRSRTTTTTAPVAAAAPAAQQQMIDALVLMAECAPPCSVDIQWRAQIWGDGPDFWVRFPGVKDPVRYSRGKFTAPDGVEFGKTSFEAADPARPVVVRVYKIISVGQ